MSDVYDDVRIPETSFNIWKRFQYGFVGNGSKLETSFLIFGNGTRYRWKRLETSFLIWKRLEISFLIFNLETKTKRNGSFDVSWLRNGSKRD
jgi:hypothetical protein